MQSALGTNRRRRKITTYLAVSAVLIILAGMAVKGILTVSCHQTAPIMIVERNSGKLIRESVMGDAALRFAYETLLGRSLWGILFHSSAFSDMMGLYYDSPLSRKSIRKLAEIPGCLPDEAELPISQYHSFNDFFTRKLKAGARPFDAGPDLLVSPADGRIMVYQGLKANEPIPVKGAVKTLEDLCCGKLPFETAAVAVIRLAPVDYHRYHFPCSCEQSAPTRIVKGKYHSVNPVALARRPDLYVENTRHITALHSEKFGSFYYLEVGAFGVGSIIQSAAPGSHEKMDEKGFFKFGGSTVILIFDDRKIQWADDLLNASLQNHETLIKCGAVLSR